MQTGPSDSVAAVGVGFLTVDEESSGQRLDNFLFRHLKGVPKTHVYRIIRSGEVRINKGRAAADTRIASGDLLRLPPIRRAAKVDDEVARFAPAREFALVYEDDAFLAIDKPAGVAVHGGSGVSSGVIEQLRAARPDAPLLELVHRLDRETSGILLIAKKRSALRTLQAQFRERETDKKYLALVEGDWPASRKVLDAPLARYLLPDGERRVRVVARTDPDAMPAVTLVRVLARIDRFPKATDGVQMPMSLLAVTIKTGRTHQIRVHLASAGQPVASDDKYGNFERNREWGKAGLHRMFLHAWRLRVVHPQSGESLQLEAPLPRELRAVLPSGVLDILDRPESVAWRSSEGRDRLANQDGPKIVA